LRPYQPSYTYLFPTVTCFFYCFFSLQVGDNLMLYRPQDGSRAVSKLGGRGALLLSAGGGATTTSTVDGTSLTTPRSAAGRRPSAGTPPPTSLGIAQMDKTGPQKQESKSLEQKLSCMSMLSFISGSEATKDSGPPASAATNNRVSFSNNTYRDLGMSRKSSRLSKALSSARSVDFEDVAASSSDASLLGGESTDGSDPFTGLSIRSRSADPRGVRTSGGQSKHRAQDALNGSSATHTTPTPTDSAVFTAEEDGPSQPGNTTAVLHMRDTKFLYDLAACSKDRDCAGGKEGRATHIAELASKQSALCGAVDFMRNVALSVSLQPPTPDVVVKKGVPPVVSSVNDFGSSAGTLSMNSNNTSGVGGSYRNSALANANYSVLQQSIPEGLDESSRAPSTTPSVVALSASMSNILGLFSSSDSADTTNRKRPRDADQDDAAEERDSRRAPCRRPPVTLLVSRSAAVLPWEVLLSAVDGTAVVRQVGLVALCAQAYAVHYPIDDKSNSTALASAVVGPAMVSALLSAFLWCRILFKPCFSFVTAQASDLRGRVLPAFAAGDGRATQQPGLHHAAVEYRRRHHRRPAAHHGASARRAVRQPGRRRQLQRESYESFGYPATAPHEVTFFARSLAYSIGRTMT
jgi:hypothetical protein